jgi:hypothetical protein
LGRRDEKDSGYRSAWAKSLRDSHLQNNQSKMDGRCGLSGKIFVLQMQSPEFKPHQKKDFSDPTESGSPLRGRIKS